MPIFVLELFLQCCMLFWPQNWMFHKVWPNIWVKITSMIDLHILQYVLVVPKKEALKNIDPVKSYGRSRNGISWTYTALIMVFWCQRKTVRLFLKVKISFSVWAMIVLGGELASEVSRRRTELASKPPKTLMANTENDIWTLRNTPNCSLFGNRNTIIRRCRSKTKLSLVIKPEKNYGQ